jgi:hypothetical protein
MSSLLLVLSRKMASCICPVKRNAGALASDVYAHLHGCSSAIERMARTGTLLGMPTLIRANCGLSIARRNAKCLILQNGWVAEWFKAPVLKTGVGSRPPGVRIPPHPPGSPFVRNKP